jgi:hypothetical protein
MKWPLVNTHSIDTRQPRPDLNSTHKRLKRLTGTDRQNLDPTVLEVADSSAQISQASLTVDKTPKTNALNVSGHKPVTDKKRLVVRIRTVAFWHF